MSKVLDDYDWAAAAKALQDALAPLQVELLEAAYGAAAGTLGVDIAFDVTNPRIKAI